MLNGCIKTINYLIRECFTTNGLAIVNSLEIPIVGVTYFDFSKEWFTNEGWYCISLEWIMIDVAVAGFVEILQRLILIGGNNLQNENMWKTFLHYCKMIF